MISFLPVCSRLPNLRSFSLRLVHCAKIWQRANDLASKKQEHFYRKQKNRPSYRKESHFHSERTGIYHFKRKITSRRQQGGSFLCLSCIQPTGTDLSTIWQSQRRKPLLFTRTGQSAIVRRAEERTDRILRAHSEMMLIFIPKRRAYRWTESLTGTKKIAVCPLFVISECRFVCQW